MFWIFGFCIGVLYQMPINYWVIGLVFGLIWQTVKEDTERF